MKKVAIYARVSTDSQTVENQLQELHAVAQRNGCIVAANLFAGPELWVTCQQRGERHG